MAERHFYPGVTSGVGSVLAMTDSGINRRNFLRLVTLGGSAALLAA